jgi:hypothetical protein
MLPAAYDLALYRGDTMRLQFRLWQDDDRRDPVDLAGVAAASQIRIRPDGEPIIYLDCAITLPNIVDVTLTAEDSRELPKKGVWDLQLTWPSGDVVTPIGGKVTMKPDVTIVAAAPIRGGYSAPPGARPLTPTTGSGISLHG